MIAPTEVAISPAQAVLVRQLLATLQRAQADLSLAVRVLSADAGLTGAVDVCGIGGSAEAPTLVLLPDGPPPAPSTSASVSP